MTIQDANSLPGPLEARGLAITAPPALKAVHPVFPNRRLVAEPHLPEATVRRLRLEQRLQCRARANLTRDLLL